MIALEAATNILQACRAKSPVGQLFIWMRQVIPYNSYVQSQEMWGSVVSGQNPSQSPIRGSRFRWDRK